MELFLQTFVRRFLIQSIKNLRGKLPDSFKSAKNYSFISLLVEISEKVMCELWFLRSAVYQVIAIYASAYHFS